MPWPPVECFFPFSGVTTRQFVGHTKDVLSVAFSADNRQIVSASRDKTIKLWNTLGVCKYTISVMLHVLQKYLCFKGWNLRPAKVTCRTV